MNNITEEISSQINKINKHKKEIKNLMGECLLINPNMHQRWLKIANMHFAQGFMALERSVSRPEHLS